MVRGIVAKYGEKKTYEVCCSIFGYPPPLITYISEANKLAEHLKGQ